MVKNPPTNAGDMGPWWGRVHTLWGNKALTPKLLSLRTLELTLCNKKRCHSVKLGHPNCRIARLPQLEKAYAQQ